MGTSESVGEMSGAFQVVNNRWKIYQRSESYTPLLQNGVIVGGRVRSSTSYKNTRGFGGDTMRLERIIEQAFSVAMPPSVIVDEMDNILHMANEINQILVFHAGRFTNNLFSNLPNDVGLVVNGLLRRLRNGSDFSSIRAKLQLAKERRVSEITNIREVDVGRPISHLALMEGHPEWYEDISYVRETLYPVEREIGDDSGRYWIVRVRPYRTAYRAVEGVIMTFVEITGFHKREEQAE